MFASDEPLAALLRNSTAFKDAGQWESAIDALYQAKKLMLTSPVNHTAETWCKLPLYLQQAGMFEQSMVEFQFLIDDLERRARSYSRLDDPDVGPLKGKKAYYEGILKNDLEAIKKKHALAIQRESKRKR